MSSMLPPPYEYEACERNDFQQPKRSYEWLRSATQVILTSLVGLSAGYGIASPFVSRSCTTPEILLRSPTNRHALERVYIMDPSKSLCYWGPLPTFQGPFVRPVNQRNPRGGGPNYMNPTPLEDDRWRRNVNLASMLDMAEEVKNVHGGYNISDKELIGTLKALEVLVKKVPCLDHKAPNCGPSVKLGKWQFNDMARALLHEAKTTKDGKNLNVKKWGVLSHVAAIAAQAWPNQDKELTESGRSVAWVASVLEDLTNVARKAATDTACEDSVGDATSVSSMPMPDADAVLATQRRPDAVVAIRPNAVVAIQTNGRGSCEVPLFEAMDRFRFNATERSNFKSKFVTYADAADLPIREDDKLPIPTAAEIRAKFENTLAGIDLMMHVFVHPHKEAFKFEAALMQDDKLWIKGATRLFVGRAQHGIASVYHGEVGEILERADAEFFKSKENLVSTVRQYDALKLMDNEIGEVQIKAKKWVAYVAQQLMDMYIRIKTSHREVQAQKLDDDFDEKASLVDSFGPNGASTCRKALARIKLLASTNPLPFWRAKSVDESFLAEWIKRSESLRTKLEAEALQELTVPNLCSRMESIPHITRPGPYPKYSGLVSNEISQLQSTIEATKLLTTEDPCANSTVASETESFCYASPDQDEYDHRALSYLEWQRKRLQPDLSKAHHINQLLTLSEGRHPGFDEPGTIQFVQHSKNIAKVFKAVDVAVNGAELATRCFPRVQNVRNTTDIQTFKDDRSCIDPTNDPHRSDSLPKSMALDVLEFLQAFGLYGKGASFFAKSPTGKMASRNAGYAPGALTKEASTATQEADISRLDIVDGLRRLRAVLQAATGRYDYVINDEQLGMEVADLLYTALKHKGATAVNPDGDLITDVALAVNKAIGPFDGDEAQWKAKVALHFSELYEKFQLNTFDTLCRDKVNHWPVFPPRDIPFQERVDFVDQHTKSFYSAGVCQDIDLLTMDDSEITKEDANNLRKKLKSSKEILEPAFFHL